MAKEKESGKENPTLFVRPLQAAKQNIHFMWLSAMSYPDHNTINRFRSDRLKGVLREVFRQVVLLLVEKGIITLKEASLDGTKIEANANRNTFVWGRSISNSKDRIKKQLDETVELCRICSQGKA